MKRLTNELCKDDVLDTQKEPRLKSQAETWMRLCQIEDILGDDYDLDRLRWLVEADKDGRCVATPCKIGDVVWYLTGNPSMTNRICFDRVDSAKVAGFYFDERGLQIRLDHFHGSHGTYGFYGKTVFLTRITAEAALAKEAYHE